MNPFPRLSSIPLGNYPEEKFGVVADPKGLAERGDSLYEHTTNQTQK
jgi:hypothetical protein